MKIVEDLAHTHFHHKTQMNKRMREEKTTKLFTNTVACVERIELVGRKEMYTYKYVNFSALWLCGRLAMLAQHAHNASKSCESLNTSLNFCFCCLFWILYIYFSSNSLPLLVGTFAYKVNYYRMFANHFVFVYIQKYILIYSDFKRSYLGIDEIMHRRNQQKFNLFDGIFGVHCFPND